MNDIAEHESRFHDHGEQVDDPYPQMSEHPLRTGVAKITDAASAPVYTITEQVWTGAAWTNGTAPGQYVGISARDYNSDATGAVDDLVFFWEQYTQAGLVELIVAVGAVGLPSGTGAAQMWFWDNTDSKWVLVAAPASPGSKDYVLMFDHTAAHGVQVKWVETATFACP